MMRRALFETSATPCSVPLEKVLHILTEPRIFRLPLMRPCFAGVLLYQGKVVPLLLADRHSDVEDSEPVSPPGFVLVCEAEFGLVGVPADKIIEITKAGVPVAEPNAGTPLEDFVDISSRDYRNLELNHVLDDPDFTVCGTLN